MKKFLVQCFILAVGLFLCEILLSGVMIGSNEKLIILALIMAVLNSTIKPILKFLCFPITFITFGLFTWVINALVLSLAFSLTSGTILDGFSTALLASLVLSVIQAVMESILS